jgi:regulation of enolase protein 1 (concanavalin A-like superfamily)
VITYPRQSIPLALINEIQQWSLTANPGSDHLTSTSNGGQTCVRPAPEGNFVIQTHVFFEPNTDFQFAGLVIYQDESNFLQFGRAYCEPSDVCVGNGIYFDNFAEGAFFDSNFATPVANPGEAYLRLERVGQTIMAHYSEDNVNWMKIGAHTLPASFQVNAIGLTSSQHYAEGVDAIPADFDYFVLSRQPSAASSSGTAGYRCGWERHPLTIAGRPDGPFILPGRRATGFAGRRRHHPWNGGSARQPARAVHLTCFTGATAIFRWWAYDAPQTG